MTRQFPAARAATCAPHFLAAAMLVCALSATAQVSVGSPFSIANNAMAISAAFDGTNYLVALESDRQSARVSAQLVSGAGARIGSTIGIGTNGQSCCGNVAFDGTNYLVVWEDDQGIKNSWTPFRAFGQFVSRAGALVGQPFAVTDAGVSLDGAQFLAYGGGKYLVTYTRLIVPANGSRFDNRYVAGRFISPDGTVGSEFRISGGYGARPGMTFGGTSFFVVWSEDSQDFEVRGRFVSPSGTSGQEISINASPAPSDFPVSAAFDGTNYTVVWNDGTQGSDWPAQVFAQRVAPGGSLVGGVINVAPGSGARAATSVAFNGTEYLVVWNDLANDRNLNGSCDAGEGTCWDVYGQFVGTDGAVLGLPFPISTASGNQFGGVGGFANGSHLVLLSSGVAFGETSPVQVGEVLGALVGRYQPPAPSGAVADPGFSAGQGIIPEASATVQVTGDPTRQSLVVSLKIEDIFAPGFATSGYNVYVAALVPNERLGLARGPGSWFVKARDAGWGAITDPLRAFMENVTPGSQDQRVQVEILRDDNLSSLVGTEFYVGYGTSSDEMLRNGRYRGVFELQR